MFEAGENPGGPPVPADAAPQAPWERVIGAYGYPFRAPRPVFITERPWVRS